MNGLSELRAQSALAVQNVAPMGGGVWGHSPRKCLLLHALRLILTQSG